MVWYSSNCSYGFNFHEELSVTLPIFLASKEYAHLNPNEYPWCAGEVVEEERRVRRLGLSSPTDAVVYEDLAHTYSPERISLAW